MAREIVTDLDEEKDLRALPSKRIVNGGFRISDRDIHYLLPAISRAEVRNIRIAERLKTVLIEKLGKLTKTVELLKDLKPEHLAGFFQRRAQWAGLSLEDYEKMLAGTARQQKTAKTNSETERDFYEKVFDGKSGRLEFPYGMWGFSEAVVRSSLKDLFSDRLNQPAEERSPLVFVFTALGKSTEVQDFNHMVHRILREILEERGEDLKRQGISNLAQLAQGFKLEYRFYDLRSSRLEEAEKIVEAEKEKYDWFRPDLKFEFFNLTIPFMLSTWESHSVSALFARNIFVATATWMDKEERKVILRNVIRSLEDKALFFTNAEDAQGILSRQNRKHFRPSLLPLEPLLVPSDKMDDYLGVFRRRPRRAEVRGAGPGRGFKTAAVVTFPKEREERARELFFTAEEWMAQGLMNPSWGFYGAGKVKFRRKDFATYPQGLSPFFGQMLALQVFKMWEGMKKAGTWQAGEPFVVVEVGAGEGDLAHDFLEPLRKSASELGGEWKEFYDSIQYRAAEFSPSSFATLTAKNQLFIDEKKLTAFQQDAFGFLESLREHPFKGIVLTNEFLDALPAHQLRFKRDGTVEVALLVPQTTQEGLNELERLGVIRQGEISGFSTPYRSDALLLKKADFLKIKDRLATLPDGKKIQEQLKGRIGLLTAYVDARHFPEVLDYVARNFREISLALAKSKDGVIVHFSPHHPRFVEKAADVLAKGYVITIDYMLTSRNFLNPQIVQRASLSERDKPMDEVMNLGDFDMTIYPESSYQVKVGQEKDLRAVLFGPQKLLQAGTGIDLTNVEARRGLYQKALLTRMSDVQAELEEVAEPPETVRRPWLTRFFRELPVQEIADKVLKGEKIDRLLKDFSNSIARDLALSGSEAASLEGLSGSLEKMVETTIAATENFIKGFQTDYTETPDDSSPTKGFSLLVQQKLGTDPAFPVHTEPIFTDEKEAGVLARASEIEQKLNQIASSRAEGHATRSELRTPRHLRPTGASTEVSLAVLPGAPRSSSERTRAEVRAVEFENEGQVKKTLIEIANNFKEEAKEITRSLKGKQGGPIAAALAEKTAGLPNPHAQKVAQGILASINPEASLNNVAREKLAGLILLLRENFDVSIPEITPPKKEKPTLAPLSVPVQIISGSHRILRDAELIVQKLKEILAQVEPERKVVVWLEHGKPSGMPANHSQLEEKFPRIGGSRIDWAKELLREPLDSNVYFFLKGKYIEDQKLDPVQLDKTELRKISKFSSPFIQKLTEELLGLSSQRWKNIEVRAERTPFEAYLNYLRANLLMDMVPAMLALGDRGVAFQTVAHYVNLIVDGARKRDQSLAEMVKDFLKDPTDIHIIIRGSSHGPILANFFSEQSIRAEDIQLEKGGIDNLLNIGRYMQVGSPNIESPAGRRLIFGTLIGFSLRKFPAQRKLRNQLKPEFLKFVELLPIEILEMWFNEATPQKTTSPEEMGVNTWNWFGAQKDRMPTAAREQYQKIDETLRRAEVRSKSEDKVKPPGRINFSEFLESFIDAEFFSYRKRILREINPDIFIDKKIDDNILFLVIKELVRNALAEPMEEKASIKVKLFKAQTGKAVLEVSNPGVFDWTKLREKLVQLAGPSGKVLRDKYGRITTRNYAARDFGDLKNDEYEEVAVSDLKDKELPFAFVSRGKNIHLGLGGFGRGLPTVLKDVKEVGGDVLIRSSKAKGTVVRVIFKDIPARAEVRVGEIKGDGEPALKTDRKGRLPRSKRQSLQSPRRTSQTSVSGSFLPEVGTEAMIAQIKPQFRRLKPTEPASQAPKKTLRQKPQPSLTSPRPLLSELRIPAEPELRVGTRLPPDEEQVNKDNKESQYLISYYESTLIPPKTPRQGSNRRAEVRSGKDKRRAEKIQRRLKEKRAEKIAEQQRKQQTATKGPLSKAMMQTLSDIHRQTEEQFQNAIERGDSKMIRLLRGAVIRTGQMAGGMNKRSIIKARQAWHTVPANIKEELHRFGLRIEALGGSLQEWNRRSRSAQLPIDDVESYLDKTSSQKKILAGGEPLKFGTGLLYHGVEDLNEVLRSGYVNPGMELTRLAHEYAIPIGTGSTPAILVIRVEAFNRYLEQGKAQMNLRDRDAYPTVDVPFPLSEVEEIWVPEDQVLDYEEQLLNRIKPIKGLNLAPTGRDVREFYRVWHQRIGMYILERGLLTQIPVFSRAEVRSGSERLKEGKISERVSAGRLGNKSRPRPTDRLRTSRGLPASHLPSPFRLGASDGQMTHTPKNSNTNESPNAIFAEKESAGLIQRASREEAVNNPVNRLKSAFDTASLRYGLKRSNMPMTLPQPSGRVNNKNKYFYDNIENNSEMHAGVRELMRQLRKMEVRKVTEMKGKVAPWYLVKDYGRGAVRRALEVFDPVVFATEIQPAFPSLSQADQASLGRIYDDYLKSSAPAEPRAIFIHERNLPSSPEALDGQGLLSLFQNNLTVTVWFDAPAEKVTQFRNKVRKYISSRYGSFPENRFLIETTPTNLVRELQVRVSKVKGLSGFVTEDEKLASEKIKIRRGLIRAVSEPGLVEPTAFALWKFLLKENLPFKSFTRVWRGQDLDPHWSELLALWQIREKALETSA